MGEPQKSIPDYDNDVGDTFFGICSLCKRETNVRFVYSYPSIGLNSQSPKKVGPYDRYCAYRTKIGNFPVFYTQPKNRFETIYRYFTGLEIPYGKNRIAIMVKDLIIAISKWLGYLVLYIVILPMALVIFIPIMMITIPFMLLYVFYIHIFVAVLLRQVRTFSKDLGFSKNVNFEKFWDGKVVLQNKFYSFYIRDLIFIPFAFFVFQGFLSLESLITELFENNQNSPLVLLGPPTSGLPLEFFETLGISIYQLILGITAFLVVGMIYQFVRLKDWYFYTAMPKDVHIIALEYKREDKQKKKDKAPGEDISRQEPRSKTRVNPIGSLLRVITPSTKEELDFICPICKNIVKIEDAEVYCENCSRYYHEEHIVTYLKELRNKGDYEACPVCFYDAEEVFSEVNWKE